MPDFTRRFAAYSALHGLPSDDMLELMRAERPAAPLTAFYRWVDELWLRYRIGFVVPPGFESGAFTKYIESTIKTEMQK